jgi:hypothetical protein
MSQSIPLEQPNKRSQFKIVHMLRSPIMWVGVGLIVILAVPIFMLSTNWVVQANAPEPADQFMQSVVKRDGNLGWHQLCPAVQAHVPLSMLVSQVQEQRIAESGEGLRLKVDYIGAHARQQGGQVRVYVVTARRANGWVGQRTYTIYTQASGCVEDVTNS